MVSIQGAVHVKIDETTIYQIRKPEELRGKAIQSGWSVSTDKDSRCTMMLRDRSVIVLGPYSTVTFGGKKPANFGPAAARCSLLFPSR